MSHSTTFSVIHVDTPATPRITRVVAFLYNVYASLFRREQPVPDRIQEAAAVRRLAQQMMATDPSFAADLYAAACRHESLDETTIRR